MAYSSSSGRTVFALKPATRRYCDNTAATSTSGLPSRRGSLRTSLAESVLGVAATRAKDRGLTGGDRLVASLTELALDAIIVPRQSQQKHILLQTWERVFLFTPFRTNGPTPTGRGEPPAGPPQLSSSSSDSSGLVWRARFFFLSSRTLWLHVSVVYPMGLQQPR